MTKPPLRRCATARSGTTRWPVARTRRVDIRCGGDQHTAAGRTGGVQLLCNQWHAGRVGQAPAEEHRAPLAPVLDLAQTPQRVGDQGFTRITPGESQRRGEPPDDPCDVHPERLDLIDAEVHPAAVAAVAAVLPVREADLRELRASAPRAENAGTQPVPGPERAEVEEVPVRFPFPGVAHRIRMQIALGGFDEAAQPREGDVVARLHRGRLRDQGELDRGRLGHTPGTQQPFGELGIRLVQLPEVRDARLLEVDVQHAAALPGLGGDEGNADQRLDDVVRSAKQVLIAEVFARGREGTGGRPLGRHTHPEITDRRLGAAQSRLAQPDALHPVGREIEVAVLGEFQPVAQAVEMKHRLPDRLRLDLLFQQMPGEQGDQRLVHPGTAPAHGVDQTGVGVVDQRQVGRRARGAPAHAVADELDQIVGIVLEVDADLHAAVQVPVADVHPAGPPRSLAPGEHTGQRLLECRDIGRLARDRRGDVDDLPFPGALADPEIEPQQGLGRHEGVRPVDQHPQRPFGGVVQFARNPPAGGPRCRSH